MCRFDKWLAALPVGAFISTQGRERTKKVRSIVSPGLGLPATLQTPTENAEGREAR